METKSIIEGVKKASIFSTSGKVIFIISLFVMIAVLLTGMNYLQGNIFDGVRSYVRGEGLWAKAQKDALIYLNRYSYSRSEADYRAFRDAVKVNLGDKQARLALLARPPRLQEAQQGFLQGQNDAQDVDALIGFFLHFHDVSYMHQAIAIWTHADGKIAELLAVGEEMRRTIETPGSPPQQMAMLRERLQNLNGELVVLENRFSAVLGSGARWLKKTAWHAGIFTSLFSIAIATFVSRQIIKGIAKAEQELLISESRFRSLKDSNSIDGVLITDASQRIVSVNRALCEMMGYREEELLGKTPKIFQSGYTSEEQYHNFWQSLHEKGHWQGDIVDRTKGGDLLALRLSVGSVKNGEGALTHYVAILSDITERKAAEERLRYIAHHDPLTGLPNRVLFDDRIEQAIKHAARNSGKFAVVFFDLDKFKPVNDLFGHKVGDKLLQAVASRLAENIRDSDTVTRLGGDEFVLLLENVSDREMVDRLLQKIAAVLCEPYRIDGHAIDIGVSIGASVYPEDGCDAKALMHHADIAMYGVKKGRKSP